MTPEQVEAIWGTIYAIGAEVDEPLSPPALDWLVMRGFVEQSERGPQLTDKGWHAYHVMESGDGEVADIDGALPGALRFGQLGNSTLLSC